MDLIKNLTFLSVSLIHCFLSSNITLAEELSGLNFWDAIPETSSTVSPDAIHDGYWHSQFQRVNKAIAQQDPAQVVFFGDSMTLRWTMLKAEGKPIWQKHFSNMIILIVMKWIVSSAEKDWTQKNQQKLETGKKKNI